MMILDSNQTRAALPYRELMDEIARVLVEHLDGKVNEPLRSVYELTNRAKLLLMPAWDERLGVVKRISVHPNNSSRGLPTSHAELTVFDSQTGRGILLADGDIVTARRTAALSLLAAKTLHPEPIENVLIIGAGQQAREHARAFREVIGPRKFFFYNRTLSRASNLANSIRETGTSAQTVPLPERVAAEADCIVSATSSRIPVVPEELKPGACAIAIGAFTPEMTELPPALVRNSTIVVDTLSGARTEAGDLIQAEIDWDRVITLGEVLKGKPALSAPVVFKSVGSAILDLAAARLLASYGM